VTWLGPTLKDEVGFLFVCFMVPPRLKGSGGLGKHEQLLMKGRFIAVVDP